MITNSLLASDSKFLSYLRNKDNSLYIRRIKEDLKDFDGKPLYLARYVKTRSFNLGFESPREKDLYNDLSKYVITQYNRALTKDKIRNVAFALVILQRRLASSTYALFRSLGRRKNRLEEMLKGAEEVGKVPKITFDFDEVEDMEDAERSKEEMIWETLSVAENREELRNEIGIIEDLIDQAKNIIENEEEIKLKELEKSLNELTPNFDT